VEYYAYTRAAAMIFRAPSVVLPQQLASAVFTSKLPLQLAGYKLKEINDVSIFLWPNGLHSVAITDDTN
jgi:hypothetical protein